MAPPIYFFAGCSRSAVMDESRRTLRPAALAAEKLDETLRDVIDVDEQCFIQDLTAKGPGGKAACYCSPFLLRAKRRSASGFSRVPNLAQAGEDLWIGVEKEQPPGPEDLLRESRRRAAGGAHLPLHAGYQLRLGDGREWVVPIVRRPAIAVERGFDPTDLPQDIGWDQAGKFQKTIKPAFQKLFDDAAELCELFFGDPTKEARHLPIEDGLRWAIRLLSINYRFGEHEQNLLHVVDAETVFPILGAAVDFMLAKGIAALQPSAEAAAATADASQSEPEEGEHGRAAS